MTTTIEVPNPSLLLHPNIPKPLHGVNPRTILGQEWWDVQRRIAYEKFNFRCWGCGAKKGENLYSPYLFGHEAYNINYETGEVVLEEIVALCYSCHNYIHSGRWEMLLNGGLITQKEYKDIRNHGDELLKKFRLSPLPPPVRCAAWNRWCLILNNKKYFSRFKNYEEWYAFYNKGGVNETYTSG